MLKDILAYGRELSHRRKYLLMIGVYMLLTLVLRLLSFFSFYILGDVSRFSLRALALILGGITALEILTQAIGYFSGLIEAKVITQTAQNLQNKIFTRLLHAKPAQVAQLTGAEIQTTLQEALPAYVEFAAALSNFAIVFPAGLVVTVICFVLDWRLFILSIGLCALELVLSKKVQQVKARRRDITMESLTRATATLLDGVHAALSMRWLPSLSRQMTGRYKKAVNEAAAAEKSAGSAASERRVRRGADQLSGAGRVADCAREHLAERVSGAVFRPNVADRRVRALHRPARQLFGIRGKPAAARAPDRFAARAAECRRNLCARSERRDRLEP